MPAVRFVAEQAEPLRGCLDILVAAAGQVHHDDRPAAHLDAQLERTGHRVRRLDRRDDALGPAQQPERVHRLGVGDRPVLGPPGIPQPRMLRADTRIVQTGRDRMRFDGLPVLVLQQIRERSLKRAGRAAGECRGVAAGFDAVTRRLEADQPDTRDRRGTRGRCRSRWIRRRRTRSRRRAVGRPDPGSARASRAR